MTAAHPTPAMLLLVVVAFLAAALGFSVQPALAASLLPMTGGHPSLWQALQVVFIMLYGLAYMWAGWVRPRTAAICFVVGSVLVLLRPVPTADAVTWTRADALGWTLLWYGLPVFLLAATSVLVQRAINLLSGRGFYWLYAATSAISVATLVAYPLTIEPLVDLSSQLSLWRWAAAGCLIATGGALLAVPARGPRATSAHIPGDIRPKRIVGWILCGAIPTALSLACTTLVTSDIGAHPVLWLAPLATYLISYSLSFSSLGQLIAGPARILSLAAIYVVLASVTASPRLPGRFAPETTVIAATGLSILGWHLFLFRNRPADQSQIGLFYGATSFGALIGSAFAAFAAPVFLNPELYGTRSTAYALLLRWPSPEFVLLAVAGTVALSTSMFGPRWRTGVVFAACVGLALSLSMRGIGLGRAHLPPMALIGLTVSASLLAALLVLTRRSGIANVFSCVALLVTLSLARGVGARPLIDTRTSWGRLSVTDTLQARSLYHGSTLHGAERSGCRADSTDSECEPLTYYGRRSPIGRLLETSRQETSTLRVGVIGLGIGSLSFYCRPVDEVTFIEVDARMVDISRTLFDTLPRAERTCGRLTVLIGDGRVVLRSLEDGRFDVLVVDAFSSDAIPAHLLTIEAVREWVAKLRDANSVIAVHASNRYVNVEQLALAATLANGLTAGSVTDSGGGDRAAAQWVFASRSGRFLSQLGLAAVEVASRQAWHDQRHPLLPVLR